MAIATVCLAGDTGVNLMFNIIIHLRKPDLFMKFFFLFSLVP